MSRPLHTIPVLLAAIAAVGCAAPRTAARPAHGRFDPAQAPATAARALQAVEAKGFELAFHDQARGLILTRTREGQAPCGGSTCLARDTVVIRLEEGRAVAVLDRQVFDPALRLWVPPREPGAIDAVEADEAALLGAFLQGEAVLRASAEGEACSTAAQCRSGLTCSSNRCRPR